MLGDNNLGTNFCLQTFVKVKAAEMFLIDVFLIDGFAVARRR